MIEGKLVNLRAPELGDLERAWRWVNDREVTRHLAMRYLMSMKAEEAWLRDRLSQQRTFGEVFFAIETKEGAHIGSVGLHNARPESRKGRLGISIGEKSYWSKGYGTDATLTLLRFAFDQMNLNRVDLTVDDDNHRAIAAYRKCGFVEEARLRQMRYVRGAYHDQFVMGILRDEFYALHGR